MNCIKDKYIYLYLIVNIRTDRSEQTVQTLIRLLLRSSLIRVCTVCHSISIFQTKQCTVKPSCLNFKDNYNNCFRCPNYKIFYGIPIFYLSMNVRCYRITEHQGERLDQNVVAMCWSKIYLYKNNMAWS